MVRKETTLSHEGIGHAKKFQTSSLHRRPRSGPYENGFLTRESITAIIASRRVRALFNSKLLFGELENLLSAEYHVYEDSRTGVRGFACQEYHVPQQIKHHIDFITPSLGLSGTRRRGGKLQTRATHSSIEVSMLHSNVDTVAPTGNLSDCYQAVTPQRIKGLCRCELKRSRLMHPSLVQHLEPIIRPRQKRARGCKLLSIQSVRSRRVLRAVHCYTPRY